MDNAQGGIASATQREQRAIDQQKTPTDIEVPDLQALSWKTPADIETSISALYQYAEARAQDSISWYLHHKRSKARGSRWLRIAAIFLTTMGGLAPIISSIGWFDNATSTPVSNISLGQIGYLMLGLAAACIGADKFFGFSSGWMRYITTVLGLEKSLSAFRLDWAMLVAKLGDKAPTTDQVQLMLQRLKEFVLDIDNQVERETQTWIVEFQTNLADIERSAKTQAEASRPGAVDITVTNGMDTENGFTVSLDGMMIRTVHGTKYQVGYVPPGPHKVAVTGTIGGKSLDASELVDVAPGVVAKVTLALPVEEAQP